MSGNKKGLGQMFCNVCQVNYGTPAEYALHEFSKKHCDNLLKIARCKPVIPKEKKPKTTEVPIPVQNEVPSANPVTTCGGISKYGYFVPGEVYATAEEFKEFNTDYDPYLQKFAENPYKEAEATPSLAQQAQAMPTVNITSFSKKKKKKIRTCQICNVTLTTVPEYEAHMRSPQHTWKLKMSGMGVTAHFVKASADLHTTDVNEDSTSNDMTEADGTPSATTVHSVNLSSPAFPSLFCDVCDLLLNSEQQYNAHVAGKAHNDCVQRKAEIKAKKDKFQNPAPNQLYCYSCKIALNNLLQYNEHKNGKKHKSKCRQLMREGITIPPEERVASWGTPRVNDDKPVIYPELYEKYMLEPQKRNIVVGEVQEKEKNAASTSQNEQAECSNTSITANLLSGMYHCNLCNLKFNTANKFEYHTKSKEHIAILTEGKVLNIISKAETVASEIQEDKSTEEFKTDVIKPAIVFHKRKNESPAKTGEESAEETPRPLEVVIQTENKPETFPRITDGNLVCNICQQSFEIHSQFNFHLGTEQHAKQVLELKSKGTTDDEILTMLYTDKKIVKADKFGRFSCSICSVMSSNLTEYNQHLSSIVHRYTEKDYRKKRIIEVKQAVEPDQNGKYTCKVCKEPYNSILDYNQHLHGTVHKTSQRAARAKKMAAKRRMMLFQQRLRQKYIISHLKRRDFCHWRKKCEKNPGVRTKIAGVATDLHTGVRAAIPNLEPLESKIDPTKNVQLGVSENATESNKTTVNKKAKKSKPKHSIRRLKKLSANQQVSGDYSHNIPPLLPPPQRQPPPLIPPAPSIAHSAYPSSRPAPYMPHRSWDPYPRPFHPYRMDPYICRARPPYPLRSHHAPSRFQRPGWPRYPSCYR